MRPANPEKTILAALDYLNESCPTSEEVINTVTAQRSPANRQWDSWTNNSKPTINLIFVTALNKILKSKSDLSKYLKSIKMSKTLNSKMAIKLKD